MTDDRKVDQVVWLDCSLHGRKLWKPLKITRVLANYVECSNGKAYNLKPGYKHANERGYKGSIWDSPPWITTEDQMESYKVHLAEKRRKAKIESVTDYIGTLNDEQLDRVLEIIREANPQD